MRPPANVLRRLIALSCVIAACGAPAGAQDAARPVKPTAQLKVFLDCQSGCYSDFMRTEVVFVDYVRDRLEADVHVLVTSITTGAGGREYTWVFTGLRAYGGVNHTLRAITTRSDTEDMIRRQLATTLQIGLLNYVARDGVPQRLQVDVELGTEQQRPAVVGDRWNNWVFSLRGSLSLQGEESSRELEYGGRASADRITPDWKISFGASMEQRREEYDLDEDEPVMARRREQEVEWLIVKSLGEHWSAGAGGDLRSSTYDNIELGIQPMAGIEFNVFPYSAYMRRQLRTYYAIGVQALDYYEVTLYDKTSETHGRHEISSTFEQRERWGSLLARAEFSQYLHDLSLYRVETDGEISWRVARGLSISAEVSASRIRDQIGLPRRGATSEEVLLRLRRLQSGYDYDFQMSVTYTFGSIFSAIVNPRFGT